jgi:hypothetical protein
MLNLELSRYGFGLDSTLGRLYLSGDERAFECFTLEDERRKVKVREETCIASGTYPVVLRAEGGMHQRYLERFPELHRGMLWLQGVPDFEWIYLHTGFKEKHTAGCLLVGQVPVILPSGEFELVASTSEPAYVRLYRRVIEAMDAGEKVAIHIHDTTEAFA